MLPFIFFPLLHVLDEVMRVRRVWLQACAGSYALLSFVVFRIDGWPASSGVAPPDRAGPGPRPPNECASCHPMGPWASPVPGLDPSESSGAQFLDYYHHQAFQFSKKNTKPFTLKKKKIKPCTYLQRLLSSVKRDRGVLRLKVACTFLACRVT